MLKLRNILCVIASLNLSSTICGLKCKDQHDQMYEDWLVMSKKNVFSELDEIKGTIADLQMSSKSKDGVPIFDIRIDELPECCFSSDHRPNNCAEATYCTERSGYYNITIEQFSPQPFLVECDVQTEGGDWTIIQRRQDGSVDFYRTWADYKKGFGDIEGEYFIGLDKLHALTNYQGPQELMILMEKFDQTSAYARFSSFAIGNEAEKYFLKRIGKYSGTAGNSLQMHVGYKFSTKDQDNDINSNGNCAVEYTGAWWYYYCHNSNLNGVYGEGKSYSGINWKIFCPDSSKNIATVVMMVRRRRYY